MRSHRAAPGLAALAAALLSWPLHSEEPEPLPNFPAPSPIVAPHVSNDAATPLSAPRTTSLTVAPNIVDVGAGQQWYAALGVLFLDREIFGSTAIVTNEDGDPLFSSDDFGYRHEAGPRLTLGKRIGCCSAIEFHYFGLHEWNEGASVSNGDSDDLDIPLGANLALEAFADVDRVEMLYSSELHNAEVNVRQQFGACASWLFGIRYVNVNEDFSLLARDEVDDAAQNGAFDVSTDNHLIGLQLGGEASCPLGKRFNLGVRGKAGMFVNLMSVDARLVDTQGGGTIASRRSRTDAACVFDGGVVLRLNVNERVSLYAGYDVLFIDGIGLAVEQGINTETTGSALYHGPGGGIEIRW